MQHAKHILWILVALTASCSDNMSETSGAEVRYVPIGVETFVAITVQGIQSSAAIPLSQAELDGIMEVLDSAGATGEEFDEMRVRVMIDFPDSESVYVDNEGGIRRQTGEVGRIENSKLQDLKGIIERAAARSE